MKTSLALVRTPTEDPSAPGCADRSELALVGALFGLNLVPVIGELVHAGHWSPGIVGFAAATAVLTGRELWSQLRVVRRERMRS